MPTGKIFAANDGWVLSQPAFDHPQEAIREDTARLLRNLAAWFTGGMHGRFLVYSRNSHDIGGSIAKQLTSLGYEVVTYDGFTGPFTLASLRPYQAIFLVEQPADNQVLIDYVNAGGGVYVAGGGGLGPSVAADRWNTFLARFDLQFASTDNGVGGAVDQVDSQSQLFFFVICLYQVDGNSLSFTGPSIYSRLVSLEPQGSGPTLHGAFGIVDLDRARMQEGVGIDIAYIVVDHVLETTDSSPLKLQLYNGSSSMITNAEIRVTIQGPYHKSNDPETGAYAPIAQKIRVAPSVVPINRRIESSRWSQAFETEISTTKAEAGEYRMSLIAEYDTEVPMQETHAVPFRVHKD